MEKKIVKMNENTLRQIVAESVKNVLKEGRGYNEYIKPGYMNNVDSSDSRALAQAILDLFNYDANSDTFAGCNAEQNRLLNMLYEYLGGN